MLESTAVLLPKLAAPAMAPHRLDQLPAGAHAVVHRVDGNDLALHRLMAMGLCVGREVEVVRQGNPLILRMLGARIGVSGRLARHIVVDHCA
jgi:Fe2+ transport system protein FeoA